MPSQEPRIIEPIRERGYPKEKRNILFLGEGFDNSAEDRQLFADAVENIDWYLFRIEPFNLIRDYFNVYKYRDDTPDLESGISLVPEAFQDLEDSSTGGKIRLRDKKTALGLKYTRQEGRVVIKEPQADLLNGLITTLCRKKGEDSTKSGIPDCWKEPAQSKGLVIVLINDDLEAGSAYPIIGCCAVALGNESRFHMIKTQEDINGVPLYDHIPVSASRSQFDRIANKVAHEIGHSFFQLLDEYAHIEYPTNDANWSFKESRVGNSPNLSLAPRDWKNLSWNHPRYFNELDDTSSEDTEYIPKIIEECVMEYMNKNGSLYECPSPRPTPLPEPILPDEIRMKLKVLHPEQVVGAYEGGENSFYHIYRPAARCKMRDDPDEFCYVCKYTIVARIDHKLLELLAQRQYPR
jgi:hypothetical protein